MTDVGSQVGKSVIVDNHVLTRRCQVGHVGREEPRFVAGHIAEQVVSAVGTGNAVGSVEKRNRRRTGLNGHLHRSDGLVDVGKGVVAKVDVFFTDEDSSDVGDVSGREASVIVEQIVSVVGTGYAFAVVQQRQSGRTLNVRKMSGVYSGR